MPLLSSLDTDTAEGWISGAKWGNVSLSLDCISHLSQVIDFNGRQGGHRGDRPSIGVRERRWIQPQESISYLTFSSALILPDVQQHLWGGKGGEGRLPFIMDKVRRRHQHLAMSFLPFLLRLLVMPFSKKPALLALKCLPQDGRKQLKTGTWNPYVKYQAISATSNSLDVTVLLY